jgi:hypothetical protein
MTQEDVEVALSYYKEMDDAIVTGSEQSFSTFALAPHHLIMA